MSATFRHEKSILNSGYSHIVGVDEVGLGSVAGPVYSVAVMYDTNIINDETNEKLQAELQMKKKKKIIQVDDSKKLTAEARRILCSRILKYCACYGIGVVTVEEINEIKNILKVGMLAMTRAIKDMEVQPDYILIDGKNALDTNNIPNKAIIKGDQKSLSIASASIVAKVLRDKHMHSMIAEYPYYDWEHNAGYLTKAHRQAIKRYGICNYHRDYMISRRGACHENNNWRNIT